MRQALHTSAHLLKQAGTAVMLSPTKVPASPSRAGGLSPCPVHPVRRGLASLPGFSRAAAVTPTTPLLQPEPPCGSPAKTWDAPPALERDPAGPPPSSPGHVRMAGYRLAKACDIPLGVDWLQPYADHAPSLGSGRLEVILGPMFAGKTSALISRVRALAEARGLLHCAVKSSRDARYSAHWVVTHDGACMRAYAASSLAQFRQLLGPAYAKLSVLAIDEGQFFPDLSEFVAQAVDRDGKTVIVAGLSGDFKRQRFGQLLDLLPMADRITQLTSTCAFCGADALFSLRLVDAGPQEVVGGDEAYRAACRRCYLQHHGSSDMRDA